jgi:hypothetical protein
MVPTIRLSITNLPDAQPAPRLPPSRRRPKNRTRRLAFEVCEPRWPLTALLELPSAVDAAADNDSPPIQDAAEVCPTPCSVRDGDVPESDDADFGRQEPSSEVPPVEIVADERDNSESPEWINLDAGPEPVWLSASLDESLGSSTEATLSEPFTPFGSAQNPSEGSPERGSSARQPSEDSLAIAAPSAVPAGLEAERGDWTAAGVVRYPWADGSPVSPPVGTKFPPQATTASAGFLDVGRLVTTETARRGGDSALLPRLELALTETPSSSLATDLPAPLSANSPVTHKTPGAAAPVRPSLTGESRGQRMMLLASTHARPRRPAMAPSFPVPAGKPETPQVQARADAPSLPSDRPRSETGPSSPLPTTLGSIPSPPPATAPLGDGRVSRSTMEGFAVFVLFAAGLFRKTHRRPRQPLQGIVGANPFDPQQAAARDAFFEQIQRADSA